MTYPAKDVVDRLQHIADQARRIAHSADLSADQEEWLQIAKTMDDAIAALRGGDGAVLHAIRNVDGGDLLWLRDAVGYGGHGQFWQAVATEWHAALSKPRPSPVPSQSQFETVRAEERERCVNELDRRSVLSNVVIGPLYNAGWAAAIDWAKKAIRSLQEKAG